MNDSIHIGMKPCHPGEFIREEVLAQFNLSIAKAAEILGVRRATLSELVNEKSSLSPEMALPAQRRRLDSRTAGPTRYRRSDDGSTHGPPARLVPDVDAGRVTEVRRPRARRLL